MLTCKVLLYIWFTLVRLCAYAQLHMHSSFSIACIPYDFALGSNGLDILLLSHESHVVALASNVYAVASLLI